MATPANLEPQFIDLLAQEVSCRPQQVAAAAALFAEGSTVPFVARYRKEATGGLGDEQVEILSKRRIYFLELTARRDAILASIAEQGKLNDELEATIRAATTKQALEDLYLPYKPKRRTRAQIAREKGLAPLADALLAHAEDNGADPDAMATTFVDVEKGVEDSDTALAGARDILAETLAEEADNRAALRRTLHAEGALTVRVLSGREEEGKVYKDYFDHRESAATIPSHRLLAILRGEREGFLISDLAVDDEAQVARLERSWGLPLTTPCGRHLAEATADAYKRLLRPAITNEARGALRERAEAEAIAVFRANLEALLLQSPLGQLAVMGLDPGYRTGCKLAVVDATGKVVATDVIYPVGASETRQAEAAANLVRLVGQHNVRAVAIGNGTGSRETERFARHAAQQAKLDSVVVAIVPETGASVYSASAAARDELPDLDVALRGAVSIARRLQDPLAELVKIEPKALGVGQYQHDVDQKSLARELDTAVEGAVNRVGVELNTASPALLRRVSGLSDRLARGIVHHRDSNGPFRTRKDLLTVAGFGPKTFELAAGFLRLRDGAHPLDRTAVHPERYSLVTSMAEGIGVDLEALMGNPSLVAKVRFDRFLGAEEGLGRYTLDDIRSELEQPGRDPRPRFEAPAWREDVQSVEDLQVGMVLEGRVSNVANFGAFVDIGVKRDGLVHLSELAATWVDDPRQVVNVGKIVKVKVIDVDRDRGRIGLSIKALTRPGASGSGPKRSPRGRDRASAGAPRRAAAAPSPPRRSPPAAPKAPTVQDLMQKFNRR